MKDINRSARSEKDFKSKADIKSSHLIEEKSPEKKAHASANISLLKETGRKLGQSKSNARL